LSSLSFISSNVGVYHTRIVPTITSRQHPLVKTVRRVVRGDQTLALLDGWHLVEEALRAKLEIDTIAVVTAKESAASAVVAQAQARGAEIVEVSPAVMDALSPVRTPSGVVALVRRRSVALKDLLTPAPPLIIIAVDIQDPGNLGAMIRSAEAGGASGVAVLGASADAWGWKALRAGMGSTLRVPVLQADDTGVVVDALRAAGVQLVATVPRGGTDMHDVDLRKAVAILIGGEGPGLSEPLRRLANFRISIPMQQPVESLNAGVAAAVLVYEARRQRHTGT
jgi:TrmH family RNA methyltransferase